LIYFDSAASYPVLPEVQKVLRESFDVLYGNSTASHKFGRDAHDKIEEAREIIADKIGALSSEIVFTSGATESNNIAFKSILLNNADLSEKKHIVTSQIEHKCVLSICNYLERQHDFKVTYVKSNSDGLVTADTIKEALQDDTVLVSVMHVNNELGTINPIGDIGKLCLDRKILFHTDAAQSFCKIDVDVDELNIDIMSISAHKVGGPKGIGAVYIRDLRNQNITPVIHGAGQENGVRGGTIAAPLIVAFATAVNVFPLHYNLIRKNQLKRELINQLRKEAINFSINGKEEYTLPSIVSISLHNLDAGTLIRGLEDSIALAQSSACSSRQIEPSHVLTSLGVCKTLLHNTLRLSFSHLNNKQHIDLLVRAMLSAIA